MNRLIPFFMNDVIPNDTFKVKNEYIMKTQPLIAPIMHRVDIFQHYFFVPLRLIWSDFEKFITGGVTGYDSPSHPFFTCGLLNEFITSLSGYYDAWFNDAESKQKFVQDDTNSYWRLFTSVLDKYNQLLSLLDYLGYPFSRYEGITRTYNTVDKYTEYTFDDLDETQHFSSLRIRAYYFIYDNYYVDQNVGTKLFSDEWKENSGDDLSYIYQIVANQEVLCHRAWKKDYFTSAMPWQQRGPVVTVGGNAPVTMNGKTGQRFVYMGSGHPEIADTVVGADSDGFLSNLLHL